jgi:hypothetical protein
MYCKKRGSEMKKVLQGGRRKYKKKKKKIARERERIRGGGRIGGA